MSGGSRLLSRLQSSRLVALPIRWLSQMRSAKKRTLRSSSPMPLLQITWIISLSLWAVAPKQPIFRLPGPVVAQVASSSPRLFWARKILTCWWSPASHHCSHLACPCPMLQLPRLRNLPQSMQHGPVSSPRLKSSRRLRCFPNHPKDARSSTKTPE